MSSLLDSWRATVGPAHDELGLELIRRWSEPHRRYHTVDHLAHVLSIVDSHAGEAVDPRSVALAVWFHDAVYDPRASDNEERSAALAAETLRDLPFDAAEVVRLVRLTASHDPAPDDANGALLCDADLGILAARDDVYRSYAAAIRAEYAHVPDREFRAGRSAILRQLLELPRLYTRRSEWEERARGNLTAELDRLGAWDGEVLPP